jgi:hypothetical protein
LGSDSHIQLRVELHGVDEETARERAKLLVDRHDVELAAASAASFFDRLT